VLSEVCLLSTILSFAGLGISDQLGLVDQRQGSRRAGTPSSVTYNADSKLTTFDGAVRDVISEVPVDQLTLSHRCGVPLPRCHRTRTRPRRDWIRRTCGLTTFHGSRVVGHGLLAREAGHLVMALTTRFAAATWQPVAVATCPKRAKRVIRCMNPGVVVLHYCPFGPKPLYPTGSAWEFEIYTGHSGRYSLSHFLIGMTLQNIPSFGCPSSRTGCDFP